MMNIKVYTKSIAFNNYKYIFSANSFIRILNFITFVLVVRAFSRENYGIYSSLIAFFSIVASIGNLGYNQYSVRKISIKPNSITDVYNELITINFAMIIILFISSLFFKNIVFRNISVFIFTLFFILQVVLQLYISSFKSILQATEKMKLLAKLFVIKPIILLLGTYLFYSINKLDLKCFLYIQLFSSLVMLLFFYVVSREEFSLKYKKISLMRIFHELRHSLEFLFGSLAFLLFIQADKIMLAKLASYGSVAIYNVSYKLVYYAYFPILSLTTVVYPQFFKKGNSGIDKLISYTKKLIIPVSAYVIIALILLFIFSFFLTNIFGAKYFNSESGLRIIAWMLPLQVFSFILGDFLTGMNKQKNRAIIQWISVVINIILNFFLIKYYDWKGAIYATLISYLFLNLLYVVNITIIVRKSRRVTK